LKLLEEFGKAQSDFLSKLDSLTPAFDYIYYRITYQNKVIQQYLPKIEPLPEAVKEMFSLTRKEIKEGIMKSTDGIILKVDQMLQEQNHFIKMIFGVSV
jgi:hypothetical protein